MKAKLPNGNVLIVPTLPRRVNIPSVYYPRQPSGFSPLNGSVTSSHGTVIYLTSNYSGGNQWYYILQYHASPADIARWVAIEANYIAPPAPIHAEGWTVNFYLKLAVIDKLSPAQFAAL